MGHSPAADAKRTGRYSKVNGGGFSRFGLRGGGARLCERGGAAGAAARAQASRAVRAGGGSQLFMGACGHAHPGQGRRRPPQAGGTVRAQMGPAWACGSGAGWVGPRARPIR
jgi:hypothetical protein